MGGVMFRMPLYSGNVSNSIFYMYMYNLHSPFYMGDLAFLSVDFRAILELAAVF